MKRLVCMLELVLLSVGFCGTDYLLAAGTGARTFQGRTSRMPEAPPRRQHTAKKRQHAARIHGAAKTLSPARKKLSTDLLQLLDDRFLPPGTTREHVLRGMRNSKRLVEDHTQTSRGKPLADISVYVYVYFNEGADSSLLDRFDVRITDRDEENHYAAAWINVGDLDDIAGLDGIRTIRSVLGPMPRSGSVVTEGDVAHGSREVRRLYSQRGAGVKVGIISDGVDTRAEAQASGDLPVDGAGLTVLRNEFGGDEGTAMLEIVHDMAPEAELFFHDCGDNTIAFNNAIDALLSAGCDVICDDIGWLLEPFFADGTVARHVQSVADENDILYVTSAGNSGQGHYQGDFYPLESYPEYHDFSRGKATWPDLYLRLSGRDTIYLVLQWDDPFGASSNDYDLALYSFQAEEVVQTSTTIQDGDDDPIEFLEYQPDESIEGDFAVWLIRNDGAETRTLELFIYGKTYDGWVYTNNLSGVDSIFGHAAVPGAMAVGALSAQQLLHLQVEPYSSQGPATIRHPVEEIRPKPDVCALDAVSVTGAGEFPTVFRGTSAAAPHVAAVAAQLWGAMPGASADKIRAIIEMDAFDIWLADYDLKSGYGRLDALESFDARYEGVHTFLAMEDFASGMGDWTNITGQDNCNWALDKLSNDPRPMPDDDLRWHIRFLTERDSGDHEGDTAIIESADCLGTNQAMSFLYHMCGSDVGTLNVDVVSDGTLHESVWSLSGPQQTYQSDDYRRAIVDLSQYTSPLRVRFRAVAAGGDQGDIALDDILIVGSDTQAPAAPAGVTFTIANGLVRLDWEDNIELDLRGYAVYRSTTNGESWEIIASDLGASEYADDPPVSNSSCFYAITAVDLSANESAFSDKVDIGTAASIILGDGFETGDFTGLDWKHSGNSNWTTSRQTSQTGDYSAQAGSISDSETSVLSLTETCPDCTITFYYKTSCESEYDALAFYIDGSRKGRWSGTGSWNQVSFPVIAGTRTFKWIYSKDSSVSAGDDTAWIDSVDFIAN